MKKLLTSLIFILSASVAYAYETCLITADGKLTDISIENNNIIDVCPIFTILNEKNTLLVRPLKEGETRFCVLKNNKDKIMFTVNAIIRPLPTADKEYSVCGNSVLHLAKVVETFPTNANGNNIKIEIISHINPNVIGKKYNVNADYFEAATGPATADDEWIEIDAFKGTDENMQCKDKQYHMGINKFTGKVNLGTKGFHVCGRLQDVFKNYDYDFHNRYFKVKALVKASDYRYMNQNNTVLVAKQVNFVEEITDAPETIAAKRASMQ